MFFFFNDTATTEIYTLSLPTLFRSAETQSSTLKTSSKNNGKSKSNQETSEEDNDDDDDDDESGSGSGGDNDNSKVVASSKNDKL